MLGGFVIGKCVFVYHVDSLYGYISYNIILVIYLDVPTFVVIMILYEYYNNKGVELDWKEKYKKLYVLCMT
jgi:hypothetical protein